MKTPVRRDQPVATSSRNGRHADNWFVERDAPGAPAEVLSEGEDAAVGGDGQVTVLGGIGTITTTERVAAAGQARQLRVVVELGPAPALGGVRGGGARDLEVLHRALHAGPAHEAVIAGHGDPDRSIGICGDERRVLEAERPRSPIHVRAVVEVRHLLAVPAIEDLDAQRRRDDDVLVALAEIGRRDRSVNGADHGHVPDRLPVGGIERPDAPRGGAPYGPFHHGQPAVALDVGGAGLPPVKPSRVWLQTWLHFVS